MFRFSFGVCQWLTYLFNRQHHKMYHSGNWIRCFPNSNGRRTTINHQHKLQLWKLPPIPPQTTTTTAHWSGEGFR